MGTIEIHTFKKAPTGSWPRTILAVLGPALFALGCAVTAPELPVSAETVSAGFPQEGTNWVYSSKTHVGARTTMTFTALGETTFNGKVYYRVGAGLDDLLYDKPTGNLAAGLRMGKEVMTMGPHDGTFAFPLHVGKSWVARYAFHDRIRGFSHDPVEVNWKVEEYEEVAVPAGTFKAFKLKSSIAPANAFTTLWYAPELHLMVKRIDERTARHPLGYERRVTEMTEYRAASKRMAGKHTI